MRIYDPDASAFVFGDNEIKSWFNKEAEKARGNLNVINERAINHVPFVHTGTLFLTERRTTNAIATSRFFNEHLMHRGWRVQFSKKIINSSQARDRYARFPLRPTTGLIDQSRRQRGIDKNEENDAKRLHRSLSNLFRIAKRDKSLLVSNEDRPDFDES